MDVSYEKFNRSFEFYLHAYTKNLKKNSPAELYTPAIYILHLGGKRIRPLLALISCNAFGEKSEKALDAALAVELFHNFSLIHDDILDKAPLRRGSATVHEKWNSDIAILSGDLLLVKAFQCLENYGNKKFKALNKLFLQTSVEVCEGQQLDMNFESNWNVSVDDYIKMISLKTASLLACSLNLGAIIGEANSGQQKTMYDFGMNLGIAFQLNDDYLDSFAGKKSRFGKQIGGDILSNKKTYLLLKSMELLSPSEQKKIRTFLESNHRDNKNKIQEVLHLYRRLGVDKLCVNEAQKYTDDALSCLKKLNINSEKKEALKNFTRELLNRRV